MARNAQKVQRALATTEFGTAAAEIISVLKYDGMPITADNFFRQIRGNLDQARTK